MTSLVAFILGLGLGGMLVYMASLALAYREAFDQGDESEIQPSDPHTEWTIGFVETVTSGQGYGNSE